ncbi:hypothetical protein JTE90_022930 [Oedothorax gibbosus]|uniref:MATH domain-containing protein n=1 Tax=Oedothorax gibbosus TaxID=931172 RepID=A0AAV6TEH6_9ARAC|nr:hypothetical protein JTE90_022930 [Oedothorax gibbosus]
MSDSKRESVVTLLWDIENVNELFTFKIESPVFLSNSLDRTRWKMCLYPKGCDGDADGISLSLTRCSSRNQEVQRLVLDCELSIVGEYGGNTLVSKQIKKHGFIKNHTWSPCKAFVSRYDVFDERRTDFIPYNVLHVRCRLGRSFNKSTLPELLISNSKVERSLFVWKIENFSCLKDNEVKEIHVRQSAIEAPLLSYKFCTDRNSDAAIIEIASDKRFNIAIWCKIVVVAGTGKMLQSEGQEFFSNDANPYLFPTFIKLSELLDNKTLYLPNDVLLLQVDCFFWCSKLDNIKDHPIPIPNLQICERFPSAENNDSQGKAENLGPTETFDKQSMTEFIPSPQKCDKQSMTETENTKIYLYKPENSCDREKADGIRKEKK